AARRHSGWVEFKKCTPIDQRPHADPRGAKCSVARYGKTLIRRCEKDGLVVATSLVEPKAARPAASGTAAARGTSPAGGDVESIAEPAGGIEGIEAIVAAASAAEGIPEPLLRAVIMVESGFRPDVVSPAGAQGLMQLMPLTADSLDVDDPFDPKQNVMAGARFLRQLSNRFHGDVERVVAAYYAGPTAVARHGGIPDSCAPYVRKVLALYRKYTGVP
ncbi:MAG: lytic transglycosylase domain-containing protein, partial [Deltaproteobacteria bacterium]|nr:lytic transglycosylase domain-containing protein [Deltaproteobacteria bacterium]